MMRKLIYTLAFIHLFTIVVVIFHGLDRAAKGTWMEKPLAFICSVNYSIWQYGFFSPDVGKSSEVQITVFEDGGKQKKYSTLKGFTFFTSNTESDNRFYAFKHHTHTDTTFRDLCIRSVATRMLNIHQTGWRVDYATRSIRYPTLKDFKAGQKIDTANIFSTTFALK
jgi:hypothetical protein